MKEVGGRGVKASKALKSELRGEGNLRSGREKKIKKQKESVEGWKGERERKRTERQ